MCVYLTQKKYLKLNPIEFMEEEQTAFGVFIDGT